MLVVGSGGQRRKAAHILPYVLYLRVLVQELLDFLLLHAMWIWFTRTAPAMAHHEDLTGVGRLQNARHGHLYRVEP